MGTMLDTISRIPEQIAAMADGRAERTAALTELLAGLPAERMPKGIVFVGSGSSFNSALVAMPLCDKLGIHAEALYPNQLAHRQTIQSDDLYVFISQGGSTKLVYEGLDRVRQAGCLTCAICAHLDAPIAQAAEAGIEMGCGEEEYIYRTAGVSTSIVSCWQVALTLAAAYGTIDEQELAAYDELLRTAASAMDDVRVRASAWFDAHRFSLMRKQYMMFTGSDDLYAVAREADIKVMEMVPLVTRSYELEEIIHGPQNAFDANGAYFIFARSTDDGEKARAIASFLRQEIGFCCVVGDIAQTARDFELHEQGGVFSALEYLTFAQVVAYELATAKGRDLTRKVNGVMANYISKTL